MTSGEGGRLVIVGAGEFGAMACEYFSDDSPYDVLGFASEARYREDEKFMGLPVVDFEVMEKRFPPSECEAFVAVTYVHLNAERERLHEECRRKGYRMASFVSSSSSVGRGAEVLPGAFVMEGCSLQRLSRVGRGAVVWNGCNIAHRTSVGDFAWIAPGVSAGGFSSVGDRCFVGVGCSIGDNVAIPAGNVVGAGSVVAKAIEGGCSAYAGNPLVKLNPGVYARFAGK